MFWSLLTYLKSPRNLKKHATFLLIIAFVGYSYWVEFQRVNAVVGGILFILALFACVVLHEYGHALMARRFGVKTRDITLYPIGGVARLELRGLI